MILIISLLSLKYSEISRYKYDFDIMPAKLKVLSDIQDKYDFDDILAQVLKKTDFLKFVLLFFFGLVFFYANPVLPKLKVP